MTIELSRHSRNEGLILGQFSNWPLKTRKTLIPWLISWFIARKLGKIEA
jgi:hypothetical protein